jgi:hypothetical protein
VRNAAITVSIMSTNDVLAGIERISSLEMPDTFASRFEGMQIQHLPSAEAVALDIPVGNPQDLAFVEMGTAITIFAAFIYLVIISAKTSRRLRAQAAASKTQKSE